MQVVSAARTRLREFALAIGIDWKLRTADRRELERTILPWFAAEANFRRVLFVGCHWYTRGYARMFADAEYWTLDIDPAQAAYGAKRHVADAAANAPAHFARGYFDLVIFNGVYGWGVDDAETMDQTIAALHTVIASGGVLLIGWDDLPERCPAPMSSIPALRTFDAWSFPPYGASRRRIEGEFRKVYDFYRKPHL